MQIEIEKYITEEQKQEIAQEEYRKIIREELKTDSFGLNNLNKKDRLDNASRLMSNAVHYILENESEEILGESINLHKVIKKNVDKTILSKKDYSYSIFKEKGIYEKEDSLGQRIINQAITDNKELIKTRVQQSIERFFKNDPDYLTDWFNQAIGEVLLERLVNKKDE